MTGLARKLGRRVREAARDIGDRLGIGRHLYRDARGGRIVLYHGICRRDPLRYNSLFVTEATFAAHLRFYAEHFNVVTLDDYYRGGARDDRFDLCLTFDDGFANNYRYALPLLEHHRLPATFFVTAIREAGHDILWNDVLSLAARHGPGELALSGTRYTRNRHGRYVSAIGTRLDDHLRGQGFAVKEAMISALGDRARKADADYWRQMTANELRALAASPYAKIGSHGYYHNDLSRIGAEAAADELVRSKTWLEGVTGTPIDSIAFPYGAYDDAALHAATAAGYDKLLAVDFRDPRDRTDPRLRERMTVNPFISPINQMHAIVTGRYD